MTAVIALEIPGVCASKGNSYRIAKRRDGSATLVKGVRSKGARRAQDFEQATLRVMLEQAVRPLEGPVSVEAIVFPPDRRADVPGVEKLLLDALQNWRWGKVDGRRRQVVNPGGHGCYLKDSQVHRFVVELGGYDKHCPRVLVTVRPWARPCASP